MDKIKCSACDFFSVLRAKMWKTKLVVLVLASVVAVAVEGAAEPDPRGFTEDPLDTEEKFRENGKTESRNGEKRKSLKNCLNI